jgi:6-phosphogluconolactonase
VGTGVRGPFPRERRAALADALRGRRLPPEGPASFEARVVPGKDALAEEAAREFEAAARTALQGDGEGGGPFRVALSGGSTPRAVHERLTRTPHRKGIDWKRVIFFFGDERCVPPDSDRSNYRMARETLFEPLGISEERIHRMRGEAPPKEAAAEYAGILERELPVERGVPTFDLIFLGLGPDGHTASLFPKTRALEEKGRPVAANRVPQMGEWRLTVTYPVLNAARRVVFLVSGGEKAGPATTILKRRPGWRDLPASRVRPTRGSLLWLLDEEAGGRL